MRTTNLFILRGRVGQAPKAFNKAAKINVATDRAWTDGKGERREETLTSRTEELKRLTAERVALETQVRLLSDRSLSRDLLEERARILLGFADPRDYVIRTGAPPAS